MYKFNNNKKVNWKWISGKGNLINTEWLQKQLDKQNWKCYYSGLDVLPHIKDKKSPYQISIERLDCNIGYTPKNSVIVCLSLNYGRNNCDIDNFKQHLKYVSIPI